MKKQEEFFNAEELEQLLEADMLEVHGGVNKDELAPVDVDSCSCGVAFACT